jgi:hypothetical protein
MSVQSISRSKDGKTVTVTLTTHATKLEDLPTSNSGKPKVATSEGWESINGFVFSGAILVDTKKAS